MQATVAESGRVIYLLCVYTPIEQPPNGKSDGMADVASGHDRTGIQQAAVLGSRS